MIELEERIQTLTHQVEEKEAVIEGYSLKLK